MIEFLQNPYSKAQATDTKISEWWLSYKSIWPDLKRSYIQEHLVDVSTIMGSSYDDGSNKHRLHEEKNTCWFQARQFGINRSPKGSTIILFYVYGRLMIKQSLNYFKEKTF